MDPQHRFRDLTAAGSLSGTDLLFHLLAEVPWTRLSDVVTWIGENPAVSIGVSLLVNSTGEFQLLGELAQWGLYLYVVYTLTPRLFPETVGDWVETRATRVLMTIGTLWVLAGLSGQEGFLGLGSMPWIVLTVLLGSVIFGGYFRYLQREPFDEETGHAYSFYVAIGAEESTEDEPTMDPTADSWVGLATSVLLLGIAGCLLTMCCLLFGNLLFVIGFFFPVLELTVLGWVVYTGVVSRVDSDVRHPGEPDIESRFASALNAVFRTPMKGIPLSLLIILGIMLAGVPFLLVFRILTVADVSELLFFATSARGLSILALLVGLLVFSIYGLWYWLLVVRQVPAYVSQYSEADTIAIDPASTLPQGYLLPATPALLMPATFSLVNAAYLHYTHESDLLPVWLVVGEGVVMVPVVAFVVSRVLRTYRQSTASASVHHLPTGGFCTQVLSLTIAGVAVVNYERIKESGLLIVPEIPGMWLWPMPIGLLAWYYLADAIQYESQHPGVQGKIMMGGIYTIFCLCFIALARRLLPLAWTILLGVVIVGLIAVILWSRWR